MAFMPISNLLLVTIFALASIYSDNLWSMSSNPTCYLDLTARKSNPVSGYQVALAACEHLNGAHLITLRKVLFEKQTFSLVINPESLETQIINSDCLKKCRPLNQSVSHTDNYQQLLNLETAAPYLLKGDGLQFNSHTEKNVYLTMDLCPSSKPMDRIFFENLIHHFPNPVPVGIAISGLWIRHHRDELNWLQENVKQGHLNILWINHSLTHPYDLHRTLASNFLLESGVHLDSEVLSNEILMIESGLIPSVFFRFPGLVSSQQLIEQIKIWGLIPLSANAWLARGQTIKPGSIILLHGNGNEPYGLKLFELEIVKGVFNTLKLSELLNW